MSVLRNLEEKLAGIVEGTFGRVFRTQVRPVEIARKLAREMDEHKTVSVSRTYVPNEYAVWLSPEDRERFEGVEHEVIDELAAYLLEHARRERLALDQPPADRVPHRRAALARRVRHPGAAWCARTSEQDDAEQGDHGKTMVYSTSVRVQEELHEARTARSGRAMVVAEGKRMPIGAGRRRHRPQPRVRHRPAGLERLAPPRGDPPAGGDGWTITDLGSTNGVKVNGRAIGSATPIRAGRRDRRRHGRRRASRSSDDAARLLEPVSVGLQFGFLAVLYLFLLWVSRSALRDLRRSGDPRLGRRPGLAPGPDATSIYAATNHGANGDSEPRLVVERAPGHTPGMEYDIGEGAVMGRGDQAEIRLEDPFASSRHARLLRQGGIVVLEDLGSTNGTYLNEEL